MVKEICFKDYKNIEWKIYLCQEDAEILKVKTNHGLENERAEKFEYISLSDNENLIIARVATICVDVFEQICNYGKVIGMDIPISELFKIIKSFDE